MSLKFTHVHSSGRFNRSIALLERDVRVHHKVASIVTHTEMTRDTTIGAFRHQGWSFARSEKDDGQDECVTEWDDRVWAKVRPARTRRLTEMTWVRSQEYGGNVAVPPYALTVALESVERPGKRVTVIVAHMPLDNTENRAQIWVDCSRTLGELVKDERAIDPDARILIGADWNKNYRLLSERAMIERHVADPLGLTQAWKGNVPRGGGTHGPRGLIDGDVTDLKVLGSKLLPDTAASDHRPYAVRLKFPRR